MREITEEEYGALTYEFTEAIEKGRQHLMDDVFAYFGKHGFPEPLATKLFQEFLKSLGEAWNAVMEKYPDKKE